jgi:competence protein ComEC
LVPHHGSATSSTSEFLQAVQPHIAVVQAGYRNRFGHPRSDVLSRYRALGVQVVQTSRCGVHRDGKAIEPELVHCTREEQQASASSNPLTMAFNLLLSEQEFQDAQV